MSARTIRPALLAAPLLVALVLLFAPILFKDELRNTPMPECSKYEALCMLLGGVLRDGFNLRWSLQREDLDKQTLPILDIYLTDGALKKLYKKRRDTLDKPSQILINEDGDWVNASIVIDDGNPPQKLNAELRLKGDWADHIRHPTKLSFRIKIRKEGYVLGMKRFSIQHPKTRNFQAELLMLDDMRRWGILAPRYSFVDVRINDYNIGLMALEEHFSKELLESQERREGPIIILDEDLMWRQRDLDMQVYSSGGSKVEAELGSLTSMHDLATSQFRAPPYEPGSTPTNNYVRAMSLYRDFTDGALPPEEVFDLQKLAKWWVMINTWYGCHGQVAHNRRFYFNPTTNLLEPIAFDNLPIASERNAETENCGQMVAPYLTGNRDFQRYVLEFSEELLKSYQSSQWQEEFRISQKNLLKELAIEGFEPSVILPKDLLNNLSYFLDKMALTSVNRVVSKGTKDFVRVNPSAPLYAHVRAFLFPSHNEMTLELKNISAASLSNIQVSLNNDAGQPKVVTKFDELPAYAPTNTENPLAHIVNIDLNQSYTDSTTVEIQFDYQGKTYTEFATPQFRNHVTGFNSEFLKVLSGIPGVRINKTDQRIVFTSGDFSIDESIVLDKGWSFTLEAGSKLTLVNGALVKIRGPLFLMGTKAKPVQVNVIPSPDFLGIGAWGGLLVSQSESKSQIKHAQLTGGSHTAISNRQDYYGVTGCISFYESDVDIEDTTFENMHCEDALNIVRADFTIANTTIRGAAFDGFDSDFSAGLIKDSLFELTGNDAVDVSGTTLTLDHVEFLQIGDKSISVGEESHLNASNLSIDGSSTGVASKDLSIAFVRDSNFSNISHSALITYIKKSEYGSASIECTGCTFNNTSFLATNQDGSQIMIEGIAQPVTNFNQQQLVEAGFATAQ